jgi:hypothetical protein
MTALATKSTAGSYTRCSGQLFCTVAREIILGTREIDDCVSNQKYSGQLHQVLWPDIVYVLSTVT